MIDIRRLCKSCLIASCVISLSLSVIVVLSRIVMVTAHLIYSPVFVPLIQYLSDEESHPLSHEHNMNALTTYSMYYHILGYPIMPYVTVLLCAVVGIIAMCASIPFLSFPVLVKVVTLYVYSNYVLAITFSVIVAFVYTTSIVYRMKEKQL